MPATIFFLRPLGLPPFHFLVPQCGQWVGMPKDFHGHVQTSQMHSFTNCFTRLIDTFSPENLADSRRSPGLAGAGSVVQSIHVGGYVVRSGTRGRPFP